MRIIQVFLFGKVGSPGRILTTLSSQFSAPPSGIATECDVIFVRFYSKRGEPVKLFLKKIIK